MASMLANPGGVDGRCETAVRGGHATRCRAPDDPAVAVGPQQGDMGQRRPAGVGTTGSLKGEGAPAGEQLLQFHPPLIQQQAIGGRLPGRAQGPPGASTHGRCSAGVWSQSQPGGFSTGHSAGPQKRHGEMQISGMKAPQLRRSRERSLMPIGLALPRQADKPIGPAHPAAASVHTARPPPRPRAANQPLGSRAISAKNGRRRAAGAGSSRWINRRPPRLTCSCWKLN
jgi:hypothetical protein